MNGRTDTERPGILTRVSEAAIARALRWRLVRAALRYTGRRGPVLADAVTYRALFSVFAAVLLAFSAAALWFSRDDVAWASVIHAVDAAVPGLISTPGGEGIVDPADIRAPEGLSLTGIVSLAGLIGAALGAIGSLRVAIRSVAGTSRVDVAWYRVIARNAVLALIISATFAAAAALTLTGQFLVDVLAAAVGLPASSSAAQWTVRALSLLVVLALDAALIAVAFRMLSGTRASTRALWTGALLGGLALLALQELSGLFVGGARSNPLLASFASLLALLLWLNLSTQVILLASAFIVESVHEEQDRVAARHGAETLADAAAHLAEEEVQAAVQALHASRAEADRPRG